MKCPICNGELTHREREYSIVGRKIPYQSFVCAKCGEELVYGEDAAKVFKGVADYKKELHYRKRIGYAGNSLILRIPAKLAKNMNLRSGKTVDIVPGHKGFIVSVKA